MPGTGKLTKLFAAFARKAPCAGRIYRAARVHRYTPKEVAEFVGLHSAVSLTAKRVGEAQGHKK
ncbi:hypothetical protein H5T56_01605 [Candidatus Bipolaricaulota bacterium]|nr:hypothetical protein [Candidatus Bipolaricaulota bacterium]